jgi:predicted nucleotidyltransferase
MRKQPTVANTDTQFATGPEPEQLRDLVARVLAVTPALRILLFGSAARGEAHADSDLDILVVAPEGTVRRHTAQMIYVNLIGFGLPVDVIVATESDLRAYGDSPGLIYSSALREGRVIYAG